MARGRKAAVVETGPVEGPWELPEGWRWARLSSVTERSQYGWTTKASATGAVRFLRTTDISSGRVNWATVPFCAEAPPDLERYLIKAGDILIARAGSVGKSFLVDSPEEAVFASYLIRFRPKAEPRFVYWWLQTGYYWSQIAEQSAGIAIPNVNATKLNDLPIPVPPLDTQRRIVARIDELFSELDDGEAALARARADLETYRKSLLKAAVTGELTADWRAANPPAETGEQLLQRILADRKTSWEADPKNNGKRHAQPNGPEQEKLSDLPHGWALASVSQVAEVGTGSTPSRKDPSLWDGGDIPWLTSSCVNAPSVRRADQFVNGSALRAARLRLYPPSTILVALYGEGKTRGKSTVLQIEATINQALAAVQVAQEVVPVDWVRLVFDEGYLRNREISSGGVQPNLNLSKINGLAVPVPPQAEMLEILKIFREAMGGYDDARSAIEWAASDLRLLRQSILAAAFRGELVQ